MESGMLKIPRRTLLKGMGAGTLALAAPSVIRPAWANEDIAVVDWGAPYMPATQAMAERYGKANIKWVLHEGGGAAILPKIKASWPNPGFDLVDQWTGVFPAMIREGWAETVTVEDVPNLADIPEDLIAKDENGNWKSVPRNINAMFFASNPATCPIEIKGLQDLYSPELKGQICWPSPVMNNSLQLVALAVANGGDEFNIDPGFKALIELAKTGNIGRVYTVLSEAVSSFSSGETSVTYTDAGTLAPLLGSMNINLHTKTDPSLKTSMITEGWVILSRSKNKKAAFDFANYSIEPSENTEWNKAVAGYPTNKKAAVPDGLEYLTYSDEERKRFVYSPDFNYVSTQLDTWAKRFEQEVAPLLR